MKKQDFHEKVAQIWWVLHLIGGVGGEQTKNMYGRISTAHLKALDELSQKKKIFTPAIPSLKTLFSLFILYLKGFLFEFLCTVGGDARTAVAVVGTTPLGWFPQMHLSLSLQLIIVIDVLLLLHLQQATSTENIITNILHTEALNKR